MHSLYAWQRFSSELLTDRSTDMMCLGPKGGVSCFIVVLQLVPCLGYHYSCGGTVIAESSGLSCAEFIHVDKNENQMRLNLT